MCGGGWEFYKLCAVVALCCLPGMWDVVVHAVSEKHVPHHHPQPLTTHVLVQPNSPHIPQTTHSTPSHTRCRLGHTTSHPTICRMLGAPCRPLSVACEHGYGWILFLAFTFPPPLPVPSYPAPLRAFRDIHVLINRVSSCFVVARQKPNSSVAASGSKFGMLFVLQLISIPEPRAIRLPP